MHPSPAPLRALTPTEIVTRLTQLNGAAAHGWRLIDGALEKGFACASFEHGMALANAVAWIAQRRDHHPTLHLSPQRCTVRWVTHEPAGITVRDFACAAAVDALFKD